MAEKNQLTTAANEVLTASDRLERVVEEEIEIEYNIEAVEELREVLLEAENMLRDIKTIEVINDGVEPSNE